MAQLQFKRKTFLQNHHVLDQHRIDFAQLPFEICELTR